MHMSSIARAGVCRVGLGGGLVRVCGLKSYEQCPALDNPAGDMDKSREAGGTHPTALLASQRHMPGAQH